MASLKKRGNSYYAQYYQIGKQKRINLDTSSLLVAKEKVRKIESALYRGDDIPLPTKSPISQVVTNYIEYMRTRKTARSVERDIYYLRETFGPLCPNLALKNANISANGKKRPTRNAPQYIEANCFEQITTADISQFIATRVRREALAPKTANR
jgi:hypothetical protein